MLTGTVSNYTRKMAAQAAALRIDQVYDVINNIEVQRNANALPTDFDIAVSVRASLKQNVFVPHNRISSSLSRGWVTLRGNVDSEQVRNDLEALVRNVPYVNGVTNHIRVAADTAAVRVRQPDTELAAASGH
jgi:osmotically-inducible protein OsmY